MAIKLGDKVQDSISGFTGIAVGVTTWLYGCNRIAIESQELKDGKPMDMCWFDDQRVVLVEARETPVSPQSTSTRGGPYDSPSRVPDPSR